ncbi:MAG: thiamine pyrophosphate-binding protein [Monoglobales bacterium]
MSINYTNERNTQILISLMKEHGIRKVVASPGTTNMRLVGSIQNDPFFEVYSAPDERSGAYIACGMAAESGEPVALSCTGATASRNYIPALTEAYYRKLPICAITSIQHWGHIGSHIAQAIDRSTVAKDIAKLSVHIPTVNSNSDEKACAVAINKALLELKHNGGGPVHINLETMYSKNFSVLELPPVKTINRYENTEAMPEINAKKTAIYVGAHTKCSDRLTEAVNGFCAKYNGVVICDQTSNYRGKYRVNACMVLSQDHYSATCKNMDLMIHIGEISGAYVEPSAKEIWRVSADGELRDTFGRLTKVFEMNEESFFEYYANTEKEETRDSYLNEWKEETAKIENKLGELPFSNIWIAQQTASKLPEGSVLHLGILNSLRSWNFFETPDSVQCYSNTGGFGIDGCVSSLLGASMVNPNKLYFGVVGDLAFFYDMNALGNRHAGENVRLMIINNGCGTEFKNYNHFAADFGDEADGYIAARGHYGQKSPMLIKNYTEALGYKYISASNKEEYLEKYEEFIAPEMGESSIVFEVFTNSEDESNALKTVRELEMDTKNAVKGVVRNMLGEKSIKAIKKFIK